MKSKIYKWHRRLALIMAVPVLLWSLSGLLHPMMANWFKPQIAKRFVPPTPTSADTRLLPPAAALTDHKELHQLKLIYLEKLPVYLAITPDQEQHFHSAVTGDRLENGAERYAEQLARGFLDDRTSPVVRITKVTSFNNTYGYINRLLPVYRVKLDRPDGMEAVVDLRTGKLASYDSPSKRVFSTLFAWFHRWTFLGNRNSWFRITVVLVMSILSLIVAASGLAVLIMFRSRQKNGNKRRLSRGRRFHRAIGGVSLLFFFMFGISGAYHVAAKYNADLSPLWVSHQKVETSKLMASPNTKGGFGHLSLAVINKTPYYRTAGRQGVRMTDASSRELGAVTDETYAIQLALELSNYHPDTVEKTEFITKFRKDYGFIFKRLPVWRVHFKDQEYWHYTVDTTDAHMSMRTSPASLVEALSFINLHKLHFLDPLGKQTRDYVSAGAVLMIALTVMLGLCITFRKRRQSS